MATSPQASEAAALNEPGESSWSSPNLKNPKNAVQAIAQRSVLCGWEDRSRAVLIRSRTVYVIGNLTLDGVAFPNLALFIPA